jgi:hypothetical protein
MNLIHLSDQQLHCDTKSLALEERLVQLELLHHLLEVDRRKLFLSLGFGSLFDYVVKELKYLESSAYRRIQAMRLPYRVKRKARSIETAVLACKSRDELHCSA